MISFSNRRTISAASFGLFIMIQFFPSTKFGENGCFLATSSEQTKHVPTARISRGVFGPWNSIGNSLSTTHTALQALMNSGIRQGATKGSIQARLERSLSATMDVTYR